MASKGFDIDSFFEQAAGFNAVFERILRRGFFSSLSVDTMIVGDWNFQLTIKGVGHIPNNDKDYKRGITGFVHPDMILKEIRSQVLGDNMCLVARSCEVSTADWHAEDDKGNATDTIIGIMHKFLFYVSINTHPAGE